MNDEPARSETSFRAHYDASQFRTDSWNELKHLTARWDRATSAKDRDKERAKEREGDREALKIAVERALNTVEQLERYWVFPGRRMCRELRALAEKGWVRILALQTARIVRLLVDDAYRRRQRPRLWRGRHRARWPTIPRAALRQRHRTWKMCPARKLHPAGRMAARKPLPSLWARRLQTRSPREPCSQTSGA